MQEYASGEIKSGFAPSFLKNVDPSRRLADVPVLFVVCARWKNLTAAAADPGSIKKTVTF